MRRVLRAVLLVLGVLVVLGLALIGLLTLLRDPAPARVRGVGPQDGMPAVASADFTRTAALLTGTTLHQGNRLEILLDGDGTYPRLWSDLRSARRSINAQLYYVTPGALLDTLSTILGERARAGVDVHFLYDAVGAEIPDTLLRSMRAAGVRAAVFRPVRWYSLHRAQNRSHARIVVVDGAIGYTGGFGIDDRWQGAGRREQEWRETNVRVRGPVADQLQAAFAAAWADATAELLVGERFFGETDSTAAPASPTRPRAGDDPGGTPSTPPPSGQPPVAGLLYSVATPGTTRGQRLFSVTASAARERLWVANAYFVPTSEMIAMLAAAAARGVDVRLLLPGRHTDVRLTRWAARSHYENLLRHGVRVFEYQPAMMHAKTMVADGRWLSIGTMNLDARSFVHNEEVNLLAWDPAVAAALEAVFLADLERSREIELAAFARRPWRERVPEWFARQMTKIL